MAKMTIYILPTKTRGCAPQSPETNGNDENGRCPSDKTRVCQKQGFRHPEHGGGFLICPEMCPRFPICPHAGHQRKRLKRTNGDKTGHFGTQEDANGEKLTVKKWWIFGADFFHTQSFSRFARSFSRFIRDINGEKKTKMIFFTVSFSRFAPSRGTKWETKRPHSGSTPIYQMGPNPVW